jgi:Leucine-rich repeat (LRR) protein
MKKLLFLFIFASVCTFGQQKVYQIEKFEDKVMTSEKLHESYPYLSLIQSKGGKDEIKNFDIETKKLIYDYYQFARNRNVKFEEFEYKRNQFIPIQILVKADGSIDYFVYGFSKRNIKGMVLMNDSLKATEQKKFVDISEAFCREYKFPANISNEKYAINFTMNFGREPRKESEYNISTIEKAEQCMQPDTVKSLMLNKLYLERFPEVVFRFKNLEELDLSDNYLEEIPNEIWNLKKLRFLGLSGNKVNYGNFQFKRNKHLKDLNLQFTAMTKIPKSIKKNRRLEILFLGNNPITFAKNDFRRMKRVKALNLYNVKTATLPKSIGKLRKLEELDLYHNELKFLPKEICRLKNLKTLAIANNQLWNLPEEIAKMPKLQTLYAHHNRLNSLPTLPNLTLLDLGYNLFKVFPKEVYELIKLEEFDITNNQIEEVPEKLLSLKKLQKVYIRGNEFYKTNEKSKELSKLVADLEQKQILVR